jgi:hypothetical protein
MNLRPLKKSKNNWPRNADFVVIKAKVQAALPVGESTLRSGLREARSKRMVTAMDTDSSAVFGKAPQAVSSVFPCLTPWSRPSKRYQIVCHRPGVEQLPWIVHARTESELPDLVHTYL